MEEERKREARLKLMLALVDLALCLWMLWQMLPEHRRRELIMRAAHRARTVSLRLARAAGRNGMALELAAGEHQGKLWYEAAYQVMRQGALRAEQIYEKGRS